MDFLVFLDIKHFCLYTSPFHGGLIGFLVYTIKKKVLCALFSSKKMTRTQICGRSNKCFLYFLKMFLAWKKKENTATTITFLFLSLDMH